MKKYYNLIEDVHLYTGLFISPFVLIFSISALVLNHNLIDIIDLKEKWYFATDDRVDAEINFTIPISGENQIEKAKGIINEIQISGEIANVFGDTLQMLIPITRPGHRISIRADLVAGVAYVHNEKTSFWKKIIWLHTMPGPHNTAIRGNWIYTRGWRSLVDFFVICLIFSSITGVALWYYFKHERMIGLISLVIGFISIASLVIGLIY